MSATSVSLLGRLTELDDTEAWRELDALYSPLIRGWLHRHSVQTRDVDDLIQEVLTVVVRRIGEFRHNSRPGAFRTWLKSITFNCVRDYWKANRIRPVVPGGSDFASYLDQLADPQHPLSQAWDREHDLHVTRTLLDRIRSQFTEQTWTAFQRVTLEQESPTLVAEELQISVNAVFIAKSRVMSALREAAQGLID